MPGQGWDAKGILKPLWQEYGGRDELAAAAGTTGTVLSAINTGYRDRKLGIVLARKLAAALDVSLAELGAPEAVADDPASRKIQDRLAELEAEVRWLRSQLTRAAELLKLELEPRAVKGPARSRRARQ